MIIYSLALKNVKNSKGIILIISLAVILICTVMNLGYSVQQTFRNNILERVGESHVYYSEITEEQIALASAFPNIDFIDVQVISKEYAQTKSNNDEFYLAYSSALGDQIGFKIVEGEIPIDRNEIAIAPHLAELLGIEYAIGSTIEISYCDKDDFSRTENFIVSGILQENKAQASDDIFYVFASEIFMKDISHNVGIGVKFNDSSNKIEMVEKLSKELGFSEEMVFINKNLLNANLNDPVLIGLVAVVIFLLCIVGATMIHNAYNLSLVMKIQQYGLLSIIGATGKQIKRCVYIESFFCTLISLIIGMTIGTLFGSLSIQALSRLANQNIVYTTNILCFAVTAVVSMFMVFISVSRAAVKVEKVSPVEAVSFSGIKENFAKREFCNDITIKKLAKINSSRFKKRTRSTIISLSLCGILFLGFATVAFSLFDSAENMADGSFLGDIQITAKKTGRGQNLNPISVESFNFVSSLNGVLESIPVTKQKLGFVDTTDNVIQKGAVIGLPPESIIDILSRINGGIDSLAGFSESENVICIVPHQKKQQQLERKGIDIANILSDYSIGKEITFSLLDYSGNPTGEITTLKIVGWIYEDRVPDYVESDAIYPMFYTLQDNYKKMGWEQGYEKIILNIDQSKHDNIYYEISNMNTPNYNLEIKSFKMVKEEITSQISGVISLVMLMLAIVAFSGIVNLIGTTIMSIEHRKKELGVLMAIGLCYKNITKMLDIEMLKISISCSIFATVGGVLVGSGLYSMVYNAGMGFLKFTFPILPIIFLITFYFLIVKIITVYATSKLRKNTITELIGRSD